MHADVLSAGAVERNRPERVRAGEDAALRPPERDLAPPEVSDDGEELERRSGQRSRSDVQRHAVATGELGAVAVVAVEQLNHPCRLAEQAGLVVDRARYFDLLGVPPYYVVYRLLRQTEISGSTMWGYDWIVVPASRLVQRLLVRPPVGKNVVLVATKPGAAPA